MRARLSWMLLVTLASALLVAGCGDDDGAPADGSALSMDAGGGSGDGAITPPVDGAVAPMDGTTPPGDGGGPIVVLDGGTTITEDGGATWTCYVTACAGHILDCGDCVDNDGDGLIDSHDTGCLGPCDNTEGDALTSDVGGETGGPCKADCYFDFGNGSGGGDCVWDHRCDPRSIAPTYDPEGMSCAFDAARVGGMDCPATQPSNCLPHCAPLTPNGCDCFGCCAFDALHGRPAAEGGEFVWIGSVFEGTNTGSCTLADIADRTLCRPCTPVAGCLNTCDTCELCLGRTTLPPECTPSVPPDGGVPPGTDAGVSVWDGGVPPPRCPPTVQVCGLPGDSPCAAGYYCVTGCCQSVIF